MKKKFDTVALFLDMSHNGVMTEDALRDFISLASKMGYNAVMLYMEDVYTVPGEPYFGYLRGRYTEEELTAVDLYAAELGVEIIPAIQTLGHLGGLGRWRSKFPMDTDTVLMVGEERTYELIDKMLASMSRAFRSRRINIGMDEAFDIGRGKYLDKNGYRSVNDIMKEHLARVVEIGNKYGYEMQMWSDMFFRPWNGGKYYIPRKDVPDEIKRSIPDSVRPVYWDYTHSDTDMYRGMIDNHLQLSADSWFAGGATGWFGFAPFNKYSINVSRAALDACSERGIRNIIVTTWGDNGSECSRYALLPSLYFFAQYARGISDMEKIKRGFKRLFGLSFDEFMLLDIPNIVGVGAEEQWGKSLFNPSKYMLYSDPFMGFMDGTVNLGDGEKYKEYAAELDRVAKKSRKYGHLFKTMARLSDVMAFKYELGVKTREAYLLGEREELMRLAKEEYLPLVKRARAFASAFRDQWLKENSPFGLEVQEARLGGLALRIESCAARLIDYAAGRSDKIPELEAEIIQNSDSRGKSALGYYYNDIITLNKVNNVT